MLSQKVQELINFQINREFYSAYLYRAIANYFEYEGYAGYSHWYNIQATEEKEHSILMMQYLLDNHARVLLSDVEGPQNDFASPLEAVTLAYEHELKVTKWIHAIVEQAASENDFRTQSFLDFFVKEQCEEEKNARDLLRKLELIGHSKDGLYQIDRELAGRQYTQMPGIRSGVVN